MCFIYGSSETDIWILEAGSVGVLLSTCICTARLGMHACTLAFGLHARIMNAI